MQRRKSEIEFNDESLKKRFNEINRHLDMLIDNAQRDYRRAIDKMVDDSDIIQFETVRNNAQKSLEQFFKFQMDLMKLHIQYVTAINNGKLSSKEIDEDNKKLEVLDDELRKKIQESIKQMQPNKKST
jgi:hypothetical protein